MDECKPLPNTVLLFFSCNSRSSTGSPSRRVSDQQGLTLIHFSAQRKRLWWDKGYLGGV